MFCFCSVLFYFFLSLMRNEKFEPLLTFFISILIKRPTDCLFGSVVRMMCACICFFSVMRMVQCVSGMRQECRSNRCTNLNTANIFQTDCDHNDSLTQAGEEEWPPFRKVRDLWEIWWVFSLLKQSLNHISGIVLFYLTLLTVFFHNKGSFSKFLDLSLLFFVFLIHLFLFSFSIKQLQSGAWPTLAYGIHTGADSIAPLIKSRFSVWWLKSFTDVCWRWSTLLLWMALLRCFCFSVFFLLLITRTFLFSLF